MQHARRQLYFNISRNLFTRLEAHRPVAAAQLFKSCMRPLLRPTCTSGKERGNGDGGNRNRSLGRRCVDLSLLLRLFLFDLLVQPRCKVECVRWPEQQISGHSELWLEGLQLARKGWPNSWAFGTAQPHQSSNPLASLCPRGLGNISLNNISYRFITFLNIWNLEKNSLMHLLGFPK